MVVDSNVRPLEMTPMKSQIARPNSGKSKNRVFYLVNTICRLSTWFFLITIIFRCPSSIDLLTRDSPRICKPYFQVANFVAPTLQPYYETYAGPYVESARPYFIRLEKQVIRPTLVLANKYSTPCAKKLQKLWKAYCLKNIQPIIHHYYNIVFQQYHQRFGPYLQTVHTIISPHYNNVKAKAHFIYFDVILSTLDIVQPQIVHGYALVSEFAISTVYPYGRWACLAGKLFLSRNVGPKLRTIYGENVEPQLIKIGERLDRYRDAPTIKSTDNEMKSSSKYSMSKTQSSTTPIKSARSSPSLILTKSEAYASTKSELREKIYQEARQTVSRDLLEWQEKFSRAADEGADELEARITEITDRFMLNQVEKDGKALITELDEAVNIGLQDLKANILSIVRESNDGIATKEAIFTAVRRTGLLVKEKAQAVRTWKQAQYQEMANLIKKATLDTLDILDTIRDTSLQEVGMRWAWTDGITYKDWTKYHLLKTKFAEWRSDVEHIETNHPGLGRARAAFENVEAQALNVAEDTARELASLKEIGLWKLAAKETSDVFILDKVSFIKSHESRESLELFQSPEKIISSSGKNVDLLTKSRESTSRASFTSKPSPEAEDTRSADSTIYSDVRETSQLDLGSTVTMQDIESVASSALIHALISTGNTVQTSIFDASTSNKIENCDTKIDHIEVK